MQNKQTRYNKICLNNKTVSLLFRKTTSKQKLQFFVDTVLYYEILYITTFLISQLQKTVYPCREAAENVNENQKNALKYKCT